MLILCVFIWRFSMPFFTQKNILQCAKDNDYKALLKAIKKYGHSEINNQESKSGNTALHYASINRNYKVAQALLKSDADTNIQNENGNTALHFSIQHCDIRIIHLLLKSDANPHHTNYENTSALSLAQDRFENLIRCGANPDKRNKDQNLIHAMAYNFQQIKILLKSHKSDSRELQQKDISDKFKQTQSELTTLNSASHATQKKAPIKLKKRSPEL